MTRTTQRITRAILLLLAFPSALAATRYVDVNGTNPVSPYTSWATAARVIQQAVDVAAAGDEVLVTNGLYATGGRAVTSLMTNRVAVTKRLTLRSVNGPEVTVIQGYQVPLTTNGASAIRCVYLTNGAVLSGFTLAGGATRASGGITAGQSGGGVWCPSTDARITNCILMGNSAAVSGGGTFNGTLNNCTLRLNSAVYGGGSAEGAYLANCTLTGNSASSSGGGAQDSFLNNCTLTGNTAPIGGGAHLATLNNCILYYNTASREGPNYDERNTLNYCCTIPLPGSGIGNLDAEPQLASSSRISASSPCRAAGSSRYATGFDIDGEPWLNPPSIGCDEIASGALMGPLTVAISTPWTNVATGFALDLVGRIQGQVSVSVWDFADGTRVTNRPFASHAWNTSGEYSVTLTAYNESHPEGVGTSLTIRVAAAVHYVALNSAHPVSPYSSWETAATVIQDAVDAATLPGALVLVTNGVYATGGRKVDTATNRVAVTKHLELRAVNGPEVTAIEGYQDPVAPNISAARCVYLTNRAVLSGFTLTKGKALGVGGGVTCFSTNALVTNCVLTANSASNEGGGAYSGILSQCALTGNTASLGGAAARSILDRCVLTANRAVPNDGGGAYYCTLSHCRLTGNSARSGGGAYESLLLHCILDSNSASLSGGGAAYAILQQCVVTGNSAGYGGGASASGLYNSTMLSNSATMGGGVYGGGLGNCIVHFNTASEGANHCMDQYGGSINSCSTFPMPTNGVGNITNDPIFMDLASGDFRLQSNSPCINAGNNASVSGATDLDGNPRIVGGTVDIGAYEFQTPASLLSYAWAQQYGLPTDGSADFIDNDRDLLNNWQEWQAGTNPTNRLSALRLLTPASDGTNLVVTLESVFGRSYFLESSPDLSGTLSFTRIATNLAGQAGMTSFVDTNAVGASPRFYRVGVE